MLHYVQHDTIAVKKTIWVNIYIIAIFYNAFSLREKSSAISVIALINICVITV